MRHAGLTAGAIWGNASRTTPEGSLTIYQMLKALYDQRDQAPAVGTLDIPVVKNTLKTISSRQDVTIKRLVSIERKLGQQNDLEGLIKELKAVLPDVTGAANGLAKMRANAGHDAKATAATLHVIEDKLTAISDDQRDLFTKVGVTAKDVAATADKVNELGAKLAAGNLIEWG
jgi:hypothetical protein